MRLVEPDISRLSDERLLRLRFRDLPLSLDDSPELKRSLDRLHRELARRGLRFKPYFWLSDEWFTPDYLGGIAVPFYLAHPRLTALERRNMGRAEGASEAERMKILRHEAGHAVANAFDLRSRSDVRAVFGDFDRPYPRRYSPRPYSRRFVRHLGGAYAQSHPDEDFAETFAVWLTPGLDWRARYRGWPALEKLRFMDRIMKELAGRRPTRKAARRVDALDRSEKTLGTHYRERRRHYGLEGTPRFDAGLRRLFRRDEGREAAHFLRHIRRDIVPRVARRTGAYRYAVDEVLEAMARRADRLSLGLRHTRPESRRAAAALLEAYSRRFFLQIPL